MFSNVFRVIEREHWQTEKQARNVIKNFIVAFCDWEKKMKMQTFVNSGLEASHINWRKPNLNEQQNHLALTL